MKYKIKFFNLEKFIINDDLLVKSKAINKSIKHDIDMVWTMGERKRCIVEGQVLLVLSQVDSRHPDRYYLNNCGAK
ncbi:hypothetical protein PV327_005485 [Microctonus hyperodae]|uniref:Uncharacterized protein n=1 Tax=Microctonus hyperodae TaxID=165561 RepID=A0AA39G2W6_MICHY|nr:hypothetical protein PV327_005485 [Microctonus hyperodae]